MNILITGAAGSLGRRLFTELLEDPDLLVRAFDNHEHSLVKLDRSVTEPYLRARARFFFGDIRDLPRLKHAMENVQVVIHCAAQKHVQISEYNPFEAVKTNVIGTQNCIEAALSCNVKKFLFVSSDKAVEAVSTYGRCKALGESLVLDANNYKGDNPTDFSVCRPPNYYDSDGSCLEVWRNQAAKKLPLTVTHPEMERYFMEFEEICKFIKDCIQLMKGGEIFVPLGVEKKKIIDLAREIHSNIIICGLRKGEKLSEKLMTVEEMARAEQHDRMWIIK